MPYTIMSDLPAYSLHPLPAKPEPCIIMMPRSSTDPDPPAYVTDDNLPEYSSAFNVRLAAQHTSNSLSHYRCPRFHYQWTKSHSIRTWYERNKHRIRILAWSIVAIAALSVTFYYSRRHNLQQMAERKKAH
jgi:hypothetical protein